MNPYVGHEHQVYGIEEHRIVGGKGDGMRLLQVRNGRGLDFTISADRCADISRLNFKGINMSYFSPCGYVSPSYYDGNGEGFLKSFTAGFLTTCGLNAVGTPCVDAGEALPLHGTIANMPAEHIYWEEDETKLIIHARIKDEVIFSHKLLLQREISCSLVENQIKIRDIVENRGDTQYPVMILYHLNMGYPLLSENAQLCVRSSDVKPRDAHAAAGLKDWGKMIKPQVRFQEQCYFHEFDKQGFAAIYNPDIKQGLTITYDAEKLPFFTEWKMMGVRDYVLGLEPGNTHPNGRDKLREEGKLTVLAPGETVEYEIVVSMIDGDEEWMEIYS